MIKKSSNQNMPTVNVQFVQHSIELVIGAWKVWFGPQKTKLFIAEALNEWTAHQKHWELNGYLITDISVYLIIWAPKDNFHHLLTSFYEIMSKSIEHHHRALKSEDTSNVESINSKLLYLKPFDKRNFYNDDLISLMLGKKLRSTYYDLEVANLINNIKHYNYCSAIDYSGAQGPVEITLRKEK
jgi:hypothetical protein